MPSRLTRKEFVQGAAHAAIALGATATMSQDAGAEPAKPWFRISLAEWSLHKTLFAKKMENLDFPVVAKREYGIEAVEYVNQFFKDKAKDQKYLADLKDRCKSEGVKSVLIMCDGEGELGHADPAKRTEAVENHYKWVEAAKFLGCHSIRVNAASSGTFEEQMERAADGLRRLTEFGDKHGINVIVENHGGLSSHGDWLTGVIKKVGHKRCGTLPDFGNFYEYDRYKGVEEMMPFAKGVSAKSHDFDENDNETKTDYRRMLKIVKDAKYRGFVGIEYEGSRLPEPEGIKATKRLLERLRDEI